MCAISIPNIAEWARLWEGRYKSSYVDSEEYLLTCICMRYIELNPVRAGMVELPGEYQWSNYHANGYGKEDARMTRHSVYEALGDTDENDTMPIGQVFQGTLIISSYMRFVKR